MVAAQADWRVSDPAARGQHNARSGAAPHDLSKKLYVRHSHLECRENSTSTNFKLSNPSVSENARQLVSLDCPVQSPRSPQHGRRLPEQVQRTEVSEMKTVPELISIAI